MRQTCRQEELAGETRGPQVGVVVIVLLLGFMFEFVIGVLSSGRTILLALALGWLVLQAFDGIEF